jgi:hypothetical protein
MGEGLHREVDLFVCRVVRVEADSLLYPYVGAFVRVAAGLVLSLYVCRLDLTLCSFLCVSGEFAFDANLGFAVVLIVVALLLPCAFASAWGFFCASGSECSLL